MKLNAAARKRMPKSEFAGPGKSFPIEDKIHAKEALSGATRSEHAGNISASEAAHIKSKARAKLGEGRGGTHEPEGNSQHHARPKTPKHEISTPAHFHKLGT